MEVTTLGLKIIDVFSKFAPDILDEELTRRFEGSMEEIRAGKLKRAVVLKKAKDLLVEIFKKFNKNKTDIGKELSQALYESERAAADLMQCPKCHKGEMRIIHSKRTRKRFLACDAYPNCKTTWPLPQHGKLIITKKIKCTDCGTPKISVKSVGRRAWQFCPNMECPGRAKREEERKEYLKNKAKGTTKKVVKKKVVKKTVKKVVKKKKT
jgi:DNA topoisomerase-1